MVLHHLQKLLEFGKTCCQFAWASVGSTFALLASFWHSTCGPSTKHLGFKTWCVLPICESWILERCGIGQQPMELTSRFVCGFLPHVNSSCVHIFTFCACALKRARLWRTGLTWPDLYNLQASLRKRGSSVYVEILSVCCCDDDDDDDDDFHAFLWMLIFVGCFDLSLDPPSQTNWLNPWHEILHDWNAQVARYVQEAGVLTWSQRSLQHMCS